MLPKPEKKSSKSSQQLDLIDTISDEERLRKKRRSLIFSLLLTVGLSLIFGLYTQLKHYNFSTLSLPQFSLNFNLSSLSQLKPTFTPNLPSDWTFQLLSDGENPPSLSTPNPAPYAKKYLPEGVLVSEKTTSTADYFEINSEISTPQKKFQVYAKIPGKINSSSPELDRYSRAVESLYWYLLQ